MARGIFRLRLPDGTVRLARGTPETGPTDLLPADATVESLLRAGPSGLAEAVAGAGAGDAVPAGATLLAPIDSQEVWGAGVTYERSRVARMEEAVEPSIYDRVYDAVRPEVFFKAVGWRVRGPAEPITVRADSAWNAPEPEFTLVLTPDLEIAGYTIGNDVHRARSRARTRSTCRRRRRTTARARSGRRSFRRVRSSCRSGSG